MKEDASAVSTVNGTRIGGKRLYSDDLSGQAVLSVSGCIDAGGSFAGCGVDGHDSLAGSGVDALGRIAETLISTIIFGYESRYIAMSGYPPPRPGAGPGGVGQRFEEAIELIEMELRHAITYVNDAVIPQVRKESIRSMRAAAETLRDLADKFEKHENQAGSAPGNQPPPGTQTGPRS
jgi:hypothetical protein